MSTFLRLRGEKYGWAIDRDFEEKGDWIVGNRIMKGGGKTKFKARIENVVSIEENDDDLTVESDE